MSNWFTNLISETDDTDELREIQIPHQYATTFVLQAIVDLCVKYAHVVKKESVKKIYKTLSQEDSQLFSKMVPIVHLYSVWGVADYLGIRVIIKLIAHFIAKSLDGKSVRDMQEYFTGCNQCPEWKKMTLSQKNKFILENLGEPLTLERRVYLYWRDNWSGVNDSFLPENIKKMITQDLEFQKDPEALSNFMKTIEGKVNIVEFPVDERDKDYITPPFAMEPVEIFGNKYVMKFVQ
jgi:hypothetical protein